MPALLRDLDPRAVALEACTALLRHVHALRLKITPLEIWIPVLGPEGSKAARPKEASAEDLVDGSDFGLTVQTLTAFAQHGAPVGDWATPEEGADAILAIAAALYNSALGAHDTAPGILSEGEPTTDLETVLLAAWTRVQLGRVEAVEPRQIACLGSWPVRTVRQHVEDGELRSLGGRPARIGAEDARRYLAERGVQV